jgi:mannose PTS system EIIC component
MPDAALLASGLGPGAHLLLVGLGAWVALDAVALGQFMVSRPLVAATLGGMVAGDPVAGVVTGVLLEALHVAHVPSGGVQLPEPGPGAVVAGAVSASVGAALAPGAGGGLALGVSLGVVLATAGGLIVERQRTATARRVERIRARGGSPGEILARSVALEGLRGALLVAAGMAASVLVPVAVVARWPLDLAWTVAFLALPGLLGVGAVGRIPVPGRLGGPLLLAGGAALGAAVTALASAAVGGPGAPGLGGTP